MHVVVALYDLKAEFYGNPAIFRSDADAARSLFDVFANKDTLPGQHPEDFALFRIGTFDNQTGAIVPCTPVQVTTGMEYLAASKKED